MRQLMFELLQQYQESMRNKTPGGWAVALSEEKANEKNSEGGSKNDPLTQSLRFEDLVIINIRMRVLVLEHYLPRTELRTIAYCSNRLAVLAAASVRSSHCIELLHAIDKSKIVTYNRHILGAVSDYATDGHAYPMAKAALSCATKLDPGTGDRVASRIVVQALVTAYPSVYCTSYDFIDGYFESIAVAVDETESQAAIEYAISAWLAVAFDVNKPLDERCLSICVVIDYSGFALYEKPERRFLIEALDALKELWDDRFFAALRARILRADDDDSLGWQDDDDLQLFGLENESFGDLGSYIENNSDDEEDFELGPAHSSAALNNDTDTVGVVTATINSQDEEEEEEWEDDCFDEGLNITPELDAFCPGPTAQVFASLCKTRVFMRMASLLLRIEEAQRKPKKRNSSQKLFMADYPALPRVQPDPQCPNLSAQAEEEVADKVLSMIHDFRRSLDRVFSADDVKHSFVLSRHAELVRIYQLHVVGSDARAGLAMIVQIIQRDLPRFAAFFFLMIDRTTTRQSRTANGNQNPPDILERTSVRRGRDDGYMLRTYVALYHVCELCLHTSPRSISRQLKSANSVSAFLVGYKNVLDILPILFRQADIYAALVQRAYTQAQASIASPFGSTMNRPGSNDISPNSSQELSHNNVIEEDNNDDNTTPSTSLFHQSKSAGINEKIPTPLANSQGSGLRKRPSLSNLVELSEKQSDDVSPMGLKKTPSLHDLLQAD